MITVTVLAETMSRQWVQLFRKTFEEEVTYNSSFRFNFDQHVFLPKGVKCQVLVEAAIPGYCNHRVQFFNSAEIEQPFKSFQTIGSVFGDIKFQNNVSVLQNSQLMRQKNTSFKRFTYSVLE
jgi:hypothetical protein